MKAWLSKTSDDQFKIEKHPCPHPSGNVDASKPRIGVLHTTEGTYASALSKFEQIDAPTFLVGPNKIAQLVPLGSPAAALENAAGGVETNRWALVQIEVAGYSKETPYSFPLDVSAPLASLMATLKVEAQIPLTRPYPDKMPAKPWATEKFKRRHDGKWGTTAGWFGHVEVPENSHWDPGALNWSALLTEAERRMPKQTPSTPATGYWLITKTFYDGRTTDPVKANNLAAWTLKQGNLRKKGIRALKIVWTETS